VSGYVTPVLSGATLRPVVPRNHDPTSRAPLGCWQLDGDMTDASGSARDLSLAVGTQSYARCGTGGDVRGFLTVANNRLERVDQTFNLAAAVSVSALVLASADTDQMVVGFMASGETEAANIMWSLVITQGQLQAFHESGAGSNNIVTADSGITPWQWCHVGLTRNADGVTYNIYANGRSVGSGVAAAPPTGGTDAGAGVNIGGHADGSANRFNGVIRSVKVWDSELSAADMLAEAEHCLNTGV